MPWPQLKMKHKTISEKNLRKRRSLIVRAKKGDKIAFETYRQLNEGLFEKIIGQYVRYVSPCEIDDLRQEGLLGLMRGIEKYSPTRATKTKPEGYIFSWVRAYVSNYARTHGQASMECKIGDMATTFNDEGQEQDFFETYTNASAAEIDTPEVTYQKSEIDAIMVAISKKLLPKERVIIERRTFADDPETLEAIGTDLQVSRERIRQIELELKAKLRRRISRVALAL